MINDARLAWINIFPENPTTSIDVIHDRVARLIRRRGTFGGERKNKRRREKKDCKHVSTRTFSQFIVEDMRGPLLPCLIHLRWPRRVFIFHMFVTPASAKETVHLSCKHKGTFLCNLRIYITSPRVYLSHSTIVFFFFFFVTLIHYQRAVPQTPKWYVLTFLDNDQSHPYDKLPRKRASTTNFFFNLTLRQHGDFNWKIQIGQLYEFHKCFIKFDKDGS